MPSPRSLSPVVSHYARVSLIGLLGLGSSCIRESLADSPPLRLPPSASMFYQGPRPTPQDFRSKWDAANYQVREAAFTRAGLVEVGLTPLNTKEAPKGEAPTGSCQLVDGAGKQLLFSRGGAFGVAQDGTLHCVKLDTPSRGIKKVTINGWGNCGGGAYREIESWSSYYRIPEGVKVGVLKTLSAPQYEVAYTYTEVCPPVPSARQ